RITDIAGDKIFFVQQADAPDLGMDLLPWSHHRVFPGEGSFDTVGFMAHLTAAGYSGPLSLEIFNDVFRETVPSITAVDGLHSLHRHVRWSVHRTGPAQGRLSGLRSWQRRRAVSCPGPPRATTPTLLKLTSYSQFATIHKGAVPWSTQSSLSASWGSDRDPEHSRRYRNSKSFLALDSYFSSWC